MLAKINRLRHWHVAIIITVIGFAAYVSGLRNQFQGDDIVQIVNSIPVHSIAHIKLLFQGGTFYNGNGLSRLSGIYYRPLMLVVYALIYTLFGPHAFYFHLAQLVICIGSAFLLYLILGYSFNKLLSVTLALVFLVDPLNSQVVYAIPSLQDALFVFFGLLGFYSTYAKSPKLSSSR
jgi:4-amino-4-deoxy-L-arabinose transferase-like glycosyltransferase